MSRLLVVQLEQCLHESFAEISAVHRSHTGSERQQRMRMVQTRFVQQTVVDLVVLKFDPTLTRASKTIINDIIETKVLSKSCIVFLL